MPHNEWSNIIPATWTTAVSSALLQHNRFTRELHFMSNLSTQECPNAHLILNNGGVGKIAAILRLDNTAASNYTPRSMAIQKMDNSISQIGSISRLWKPLAYPRLFPHEEYLHGDSTVTQIWHYRSHLLREQIFKIFRRLANEYMVDMWTREVNCRLADIRINRIRIRQEDAELMGVVKVETSSNICIPTSFLGGHEWSSEQVSDALSIAAVMGNPSFFIMETVNPNWPEVTSQLRPGQTWADIPAVVIWVFYACLSTIMLALSTMFPNAGLPIYKISMIGFQKRGLPHAHILLKFHVDCIMAEDINAVVSAELPTSEEDAILVRNWMVHKHRAHTSSTLSGCQQQSNTGKSPAFDSHTHFRREQPSTIKVKSNIGEDIQGMKWS
ncbi:hypothetical protein M422DRAFT_269005 [Sphaerobolus stellatus SS14]|uniref:Unplaced genomic scaffold SPHSTscaffold_205, whole genome shotgun sequence n=1 Tax=Sphaerobolus stellatus (strain SS14) TaxID=990650 RepID=A0A0C9UWN0_SPHS4|nr:hypothetical protein M422DRAFT_269005 [Sphaerobolus stellatus SS14]